MNYHLLNQVKQDAHDILMGEAFAQIYQQAEEDFLELARENARIRNIQASFFAYNGKIYPQQTVNGTSIVKNKVHVVAPPLHFLLIEHFDIINKRIEAPGKDAICNFFTAVLDCSSNGIVLDGLLPSVLVNALRKKLDSSDFFVLNQGRTEGAAPEPAEMTEQNMQAVRRHYGKIIEDLRHLLMNKLLLSR